MMLVSMLMAASCPLLLVLTAAHDAPPPLLRNLRVDPGSRRLLWDPLVAGGDGPTVEDVRCTKDGYEERVRVAAWRWGRGGPEVPPPTHSTKWNILETEARAQGRGYCEFPTLDVCRVSNFTLSYDVIESDVPLPHTTPSAGGGAGTMVRRKRTRVTSWILYPDDHGEGSHPGAASNVTCRVHDMDMLSCAWTPGTADMDAVAGGDLQYRMTWADAMADTRKEEECTQYVLSGDGRGVRVGCHVEEAGRLSRAVSVTVTTLRHGADIACTSATFAMAAIEVLTAPRVQVRCNASLAELRWALTSHFHGHFCYQLRLRKGSGDWLTETVKEDGPAQRGHRKNKTNMFTVHNPGSLTVQIRAKPVFHGEFSDWSPPETHACDAREAGEEEMRVWLTPLLAASGMALALTLAACFCTRLSLLARMFPPIPRVKDPLGDAGLPDGTLMPTDACEEEEEPCPTSPVCIVTAEEGGP